MHIISRALGYRGWGLAPDKLGGAKLLQGDDPHKLWRSDCSVRGGLHHSFVALWVWVGGC